MPELAAIYFAGVMFGLVTTVLFVFYSRRQKNGRAYQTLQANLKKVGLFWSDHQDRLIPWTPEVATQEDQQSGRSMTIAGTLLSALSWPGVLFYMIIIYSVLVIARSRTEKKVFASRLSKDGSLTAQEVMNQIKEIFPSGTFETLAKLESVGTPT